MILADFHTHTSFSSDSTASMESMIESAISKGLKIYCITDHMDAHYPHPDFGTFTFDPDTYFDSLTKFKEKYNNKIDLRFGIELGLRNEPDLTEVIDKEYTKLVNSYPFDFIIGSTHVLNHCDPYLPQFWANKSSADGIHDYFVSIQENASNYDMFQIYGHLDYIVRYIPDKVKAYQETDYQDLIDSMLLSIIHHGKGIECNTSGFKYGLGVPHPKPTLLKRYRELGGELLTIGSDAHKPEHIAYDFIKAEELLKELGFRYYTVYKDRKPEFIKL